MFVGPSRKDVLARLRGRKPHKYIPMTLGHGEPRAVIAREERPEDARWLLRALVINEAKADAEGERRLARGEPWMPEMRWQYAEPTEVLLYATTAAGLADALEEADLDLFGR